MLHAEFEKHVRAAEAKLFSLVSQRFGTQSGPAWASFNTKVKVATVDLLSLSELRESLYNVVKDGEGWRTVYNGNITAPCFNSPGAAEAYLDSLVRGDRQPEY